MTCCLLPGDMMDLYDRLGATVPRETKLKDLHTPRSVNVGRGVSILQDIKMITGLCKLGVTGINEKNSSVFCSAICNLTRLESLSVRSAGKLGLHV